MTDLQEQLEDARDQRIRKLNDNTIELIARIRGVPLSEQQTQQLLRVAMGNERERRLVEIIHTEENA